MNSFVVKQTKPDGTVIRVLNTFITCSSEKEAYARAQKLGGGARPDKHRPHVKPGDTSGREFFHHYHPGNHILKYENGIWVNYHFMWEDEQHQRQFGWRNWNRMTQLKLKLKHLWWEGNRCKLNHRHLILITFAWRILDCNPNSETLDQDLLFPEQWKGRALCPSPFTDPRVVRIQLRQRLSFFKWEATIYWIQSHGWTMLRALQFFTSHSSVWVACYGSLLFSYRQRRLFIHLSREDLLDSYFEHLRDDMWSIEYGIVVKHHSFTRIFHCHSIAWTLVRRGSSICTNHCHSGPSRGTFRQMEWLISSQSLAVITGSITLSDGSISTALHFDPCLS